MNKKFSTLLVGALLTSSVGAFAQTTVGTQVNKVGNDIKLRPTATASAEVGDDVMNFEGVMYYQLANEDGSKVLIQSRDYKTGELTLKFVEPSAAPINASLWKITVTGDDVSGFSFVYTNRETDFPITFDAAKAVKFDADFDATKLVPSILEGCVENWNWYKTDDNGAEAFDVEEPYSYFKSDSVMVLAENADVVTAVKARKSDLSNTTLTGSLIAIKPVLADAITLNAADLNNMVDFQYDDSLRFAMNPGPKNGTTALSEVLTAYNFKAIAAKDYKTAGFTSTEADYVVFENKDKGLLMVDTTFYNSGLPSLTPLKIDVKKFATVKKSDGSASALTPEVLSKRYQFKVTYYPSVDSLDFAVLEGGAYKITDAEKNAGTTWADAATLVAGDADTEGAVLKLVYLTPTHTELTAGKAYIEAGKYEDPGTIFTKINFADRDFTYLTRTTIPSEGLFFITDAKSGKNVVCNFKGTMMLDAATVAQDYNDMPATMWVAQNTGCTTSMLSNREYAKENPVFTGQWYVNEDGQFYFINKNYAGFAGNQLDYKANYIINAVGKETDAEKAAWGDQRHGYQNTKTEDLLTKKFYLGYNLFADQDLYLNVTDSKSFAPSKEQSTFYELEEVANAKDISFGTGANVAGLPQLKRTAYSLKVKDANLVDNDKVYVYLVQKYGKTPYYQALTLTEKADLEAAKATVTRAYFYMKADQVREGEIAYVLVDINNGTTLETSNGFVQAHCEDAVGELSFLGLDNTAEERASAFVLENVNIALYRTIESGKTAKIFRQRGTAKEYLYEDTNNKVSAPSVIKDFGYLGLTAEGIVPEGKGTTTAMYAQYVKASNEIMPQYLFAVDTVTVKDGKWCATDEHGYIQEGDPHSDHTVSYIGYLAGRFMVNLTDSLEKKDGMLNNADNFKYAGYDRLGFVEGIFRVEDGKEYLYILKGGNTLESVQAKYGVVAPETFADANVFDKKELDGKHANYAFSLRLINEDPEKDFLIESKGEGSAIGSFKGAWVKVQNSCPVLAKFTTTGSDHADEAGTIEELINNAQIFNIEEGLDEVATGNEGIDAPATISVIAENGAIRVLNAAGKAVTVSNVLGQTIASTVVTSDDAKINTPAGLVVVAVDGEAAVKAIVK